MALPPLAPLSALETRLGLAAGTLTGTDRARAEADLADASVLIRAEAGVSYVADDGVTITAPDAVVTVAVRAARRAYLNPEDLTGENVGEYGWQRREAGVYLTADEVRIVRKAAGKRATLGTGSVRVRSAYSSPTTEPVDSVVAGL
jgi:hypothetical protein